MKVLRRCAALSIIPILAVALAACNNADPATIGPAATQASDSAGIPADLVPEVAVSEQLAAGVAEKYRKDGVIFGHSGEALPMNTVQDGVQRGVDMDIVRAVSKVLGVEPKFIEVKFDGLIPGIKAGRMNVIQSSMADYKERQQQIDFVDYFEMSVSLNVEKGNPENLKTLKDLCGHKVATTRGTGAEKGLEAASKDCTAAGKEAIEIMAFPDGNAALTSLITHRVVASTADSPSAVYATKKFKGGEAVEVAPEPLYGGVFYGAGFLKEDVGLRDSYQAALQQLIDSGWYDRLLKSYGLQDGALDKATVNAGGDRPFSK